MAKNEIPIVDFHSHILPFVDHGSASLEMSERMLKQAKKAGVVTIVATPHFYANKMDVDEFLLRRKKGFSALTELMEEKKEVAIPIRLGAEVALDKRLRDIDDLSRLAIEGTDHILIEMPMFEKWQNWMYDLLYEIQSKHHVRVIIAHIDRYWAQKMEKLIDCGFTIQINASAFFKRREKHYYHCLTADGSIHLIGSDAHSDKKRNYKAMIKASKKIDSSTLAYFYDNAMDVLE